MATITIRHVNAGDPAGTPAKFQAIDKEGDRQTESKEIPSPIGFPVVGMPQSDLQSQLKWYLEEFLGYPFSPQTEQAERVLEALKLWGQTAFNALFNDRIGASIIDDAGRAGLDKLNLFIASDDPQVLGWPWEGLFDPLKGQLAQTCQIERRLSKTAKPDDIPQNWPDDRVNILLVIARPYPGDVKYRSISRPLVELIEKKNLPAEVTVLRPPTLANLRQHLKARPNYYHIVHFDGHGSYGEKPNATINPHATLATKGHLVFEDAEGNPNPIPATDLSVLLREFHIPTVVLNACQSAMVDGRAVDPFASVAAALLQAGIRNVVAMAYSLYVSGAQVFLPAFYDELFGSGSVSQAVRAGRQGMFQNKGRVCARGTHPLHDWLVPVVYQNAPFAYDFATKATKAPDARPELPPGAAGSDNLYGFVGRDGAVLALERAMHRPPAGLLIQGLGGVGKTTLARGFLQWLRETNGLGNGAFWFTFQDIRSAEFIFSEMGAALFGPNFLMLKVEAKLDALTDVFNKDRYLIVWDNFEVVRGIPGTSVSPTLSDADQALLKNFLARLRGGLTKVIITSRSDETWLNPHRFEIPIGGLQDEERWDYCAVILRDLGLTIDRKKDTGLVELMDFLGGHPLAMRVVVPRLVDTLAYDLLDTLKTNITALGPSGDPAQDHLFATLRFAVQSLPEELCPILIPLSLHERFVDADYLEVMAEQVELPFSRPQINQAFDALSMLGLLNDQGQAIFELHPALTGFLRTTLTKETPAEFREGWTRAFVSIMSVLANNLAPQPLHQKRALFFLHGANFHIALAEAERLEMDINFEAIVQSLAAHAQGSRNFQEADRLYARLATSGESRGDWEGQAAAYHQLGIVAQEGLDFTAAEAWYRKSLEISERRNNEHGAALTYHQLGTVAEDGLDFTAAEAWYRKSLEISERRTDEHTAALTYHQLGIVAQARRDITAAEAWYRKSLEIKVRRNNEHGAARTYHQLGMVATERRDFAAAETWYRKSLEIKERQKDQHGAASTYHQLGMVATERRDFAAAETWYLKSLEISERLGNEQHAALTYHQLGRVAEERRDFAAAETWYRKSLEIKERQKDQHGAARTYHQLGMVAEERRDFAAAETWYLKSLGINERLGDEHGAALTYHQLGMVAQKRRDFAAAETWYLKALEIEERLRDEHGAASTYHQLGTVAEERRDFATAQEWFEKALAVFVRLEDSHSAGVVRGSLERLRAAEGGPQPEA